MSIVSEAGRLHTGLVTGRYRADGVFRNYLVDLINEESELEKFEFPRG